jgi:hypothetical protein
MKLAEQGKITKGVFFSDDAGKVNLGFSSRKIERELLTLLMEERYQELKKYLDSISLQDKENFFKKKGSSMLYDAVANANDAESLKIIVEHINPCVLQELLRDKDFQILKGFASTQRALEDYIFPHQTKEEIQYRRELFNEKLKLIDNIDPKILPDFLNQHEGEIYMQKSVTHSIKNVGRV